MKKISVLLLAFLLNTVLSANDTVFTGVLTSYDYKVYRKAGDVVNYVPLDGHIKVSAKDIYVSWNKRKGIKANDLSYVVKSVVEKDSAGGVVWMIVAVDSNDDLIICNLRYNSKGEWFLEMNLDTGIYLFKGTGGILFNPNK